MNATTWSTHTTARTISRNIARSKSTLHACPRHRERTTFRDSLTNPKQTGSDRPTTARTTGIEARWSVTQSLLSAARPRPAPGGPSRPACRPPFRIRCARPALPCRVLDENRERRPAVDLGERQGVQRGVRIGVGDPLVDLGRDEPLVRDDLAVLAVEADLDVAVRHHHVPPRSADPQVDLADRHLPPVRVTPALDQLGRRPRLVDEVLRGVELPRDEDLLIGGERHLRGLATRHSRHFLPPFS